MKRLGIGAVMVVMVSALAAPRPAKAQAAVARELVEEATEQIFKSAARQGAEDLARMGGRVAVRDILEQSSREGGEQLVKRVTQYGIEDGPIALRAIRPAPAKMVEALDGLSPQLRAAAFRAVDREPALMANLVRQYGSGALEVASRHPGVGDRLVETLGDQGISLGRGLTTDQSIVAARYADDIAKLPSAQRAGIVNKIVGSPAAVLNYLEAHPRVLRTAAGVAVVMAIKDDILGDKGRSIVRPDGTVVTTPPHPGLIERMFPQTLRFASFPATLLVLVLAGGVAGWFAVHLWGKWRIQRLRQARLANADGRFPNAQ
jgi:hypothetical protein